MSWYRTGTVTVTSNSDVVNGVGTDWISSAKEGETLIGPDNFPYEIVQLLSATQLRIRPAYRGNTAAGQVYAIMPTQSYMRDLASQVSQLVNIYSGVRDNAGTGKFAAGTAGVPSLRGLADQDTGINFPGDNLLQLIAGGVMQLGIDASGGCTGPAVAALAGKIIESGSNANGTFERFASGLQICRKRYVLNGVVNPGQSVTPDIHFAAAFADAPMIQASVVFFEGLNASGDQLYSASFGYRVGDWNQLSIINTGVKPSLSHPNFSLGATIANSADIDAVAFGRWK